MLALGVASNGLWHSRLSRISGLFLVLINGLILFSIFVTPLFSHKNIIRQVALLSDSISLFTLAGFVLLGAVLMSSRSGLLKKLQVVEVGTSATLLLSLIIVFGYLFQTTRILTYSIFSPTPFYIAILFACFSLAMFFLFRSKYDHSISLRSNVFIFLTLLIFSTATLVFTNLVETSLSDKNFNQSKFFQLFPTIIVGLGMILSVLLAVVMYVFAAMKTRAVMYANEVTKGLRQGKAKDEAMLESIGEGLVATGKDGNIVLINRAFEDLLGWKEADLQGKLLTHVLPILNDKGQKLEDTDVLLKKILKDGNKLSSQFLVFNQGYYQSKHGRIFPVSITISPILVEGQVIGAVEVFRDVTKEKEIDKEKTEFVSLASHQLRTPLSTINWYTEMLLSGDVGDLTDSQKKYLSEIYSGSQRMVALVNSLLNVSRLELGTFTIEPEEIDLKELVSSVAKEQEHQLAEKEINLDVNISEDLPKLQADSKLLHMVFQNLLSNAIKYTNVAGTVKIAISLEKENILVKVTDSGWGIPKDEQDKVFSKLFRASNVKEQDTEGTGLGLYIVKSVVEQSGGSIHFESEENKGTTFFITFPKTGMKKKEGSRHLS